MAIEEEPEEGLSLDRFSLPCGELSTKNETLGYLVNARWKRCCALGPRHAREYIEVYS